MNDDKTLKIQEDIDRSQMPDLGVQIAGIRWKNPVSSASGTLSITDSSEFYDLNALGAVITKGVTSVPWRGNPTPRIAETYAGMLNCVGLQNPGVDHFLSVGIKAAEERLDETTPLVVNVAGRTVDEYLVTVEKLSGEKRVDMLEVNISCPNIKEGGISFGTDPKMASNLTRRIKNIAQKPVIVKLTPNVTDIATIAQAVQEAGADAISLINTLKGMKIDIYNKKPVLASGMGGLSGPAIKPVALRMVYEVAAAVDIPVIGLGGIMTGEDAIEFIMAGAAAVSVGTASLSEPDAPVRIIGEIKRFMQENGYKSIGEIREAYGQ